MNDGINKSEDQSAYTPERRAFHEAGHVVSHRCFGDPAEIGPADIYFDKETQRGGQVVVPPHDSTGLQAVGTIVSTYAGVASENIQYGDEDYRGALDDLAEARRLCLQIANWEGAEVTEESICAFLAACVDAAIEILERRWSCVEKVASALLLKEKIERSEIIELTVDCHPDEYLHHARTLFDMLIPPE